MAHPGSDNVSTSESPRCSTSKDQPRRHDQVRQKVVTMQKQGTLHEPNTRPWLRTEKTFDRNIAEHRRVAAAPTPCFVKTQEAAQRFFFTART